MCPQADIFVARSFFRSAAIASRELKASRTVQRFYFPFGRVVKIFYGESRIREMGFSSLSLWLFFSFLVASPSPRKKIQFPRTYDCWPFLCLKFFFWPFSFCDIFKRKIKLGMWRLIELSVKNYWLLRILKIKIDLDFYQETRSF